MVYDKHIGKVVLVELPNNSSPRWRWIVKKRDDGRYIARAPKIGVLIRDLDKKLEKDYNSEHLLPKNFSFWKSPSWGLSKGRKSKRSKKNKSRKNKTKKRYFDYQKL